MTKIQKKVERVQKELIKLGWWIDCFENYIHVDDFAITVFENPCFQ